MNRFLLVGPEKIGKSGPITDEHCRALFQASQAIWACIEKTKTRRQTELESLYFAAKNGRPTDLIVELISTFYDEIGVLCNEYAESVQAHADAVDELRRNGLPQPQGEQP